MTAAFESQDFSVQTIGIIATPLFLPCLHLCLPGLPKRNRETAQNPDEVFVVHQLRTALVFALSCAVIFNACPPAPLQAFPAAPSAAAYASPWPKVFDRNGAHIVVYQPQVKSWRNYRSLIADTAISITQPNAKPILGVISWHADTITNVNARTVFVANIVVVSSRFPFSKPLRKPPCSNASARSIPP